MANRVGPEGIEEEFKDGEFWVRFADCGIGHWGEITEPVWSSSAIAIPSAVCLFDTSRSTRYAIPPLI